jgi:quinol monooxygenase YgiN
VVILHAVVVIEPDARERWLEILAAVTPPSRAEEACESYIVYESVDVANTFIFVEEWASTDGLMAHFHTPHFTQFFGSLGEVVAQAPVGRISTVSSSITLDDAFAAEGIG